MKEKKMTVREMIEARFSNCTRMNEIADTAEAREGKELTDAEKAAFMIFKSPVRELRPLLLR